MGYLYFQEKPVVDIYNKQYYDSFIIISGGFPLDFGQLTLEEIKQGYRFDPEVRAYACNYCEQPFPEGQVFSMGDGLYTASHAVVYHTKKEHGGVLPPLLHYDTKYNTLTDNQRELLALFHSNLPDSEIAKKLGVTPSTIRHQKFTFREKAKQAKYYLALFENAFADKGQQEEQMIPIHNQATYYDDRYVITEQEKNHMLETAFASLEPLVLSIFPRKEKKKVVILAKIAEQFTPGRKYTEKEVTAVIQPIFDDYVCIRRYLIMYGFMEREADGSLYWLTS